MYTKEDSSSELNLVTIFCSVYNPTSPHAPFALLCFVLSYKKGQPSGYLHTVTIDL